MLASVSSVPTQQSNREPLCPQVQQAVGQKAQAAIQSAAAAPAAGGLYDWESLDVLQQLMYGTTDISPAALKEELGEEIAQIYTGGRVRDSEDRLVLNLLHSQVLCGIARNP